MATKVLSSHLKRGSKQAITIGRRKFLSVASLVQSHKSRNRVNLNPRWLGRTLQAAAKEGKVKASTAYSSTSKRTVNVYSA